MTPKLADLINTYLSIVDSNDDERQGEERTQAHDAMMDQMSAEGILFEHRAEAREIARRMVALPVPVQMQTIWMWSAHSLGADSVRHSFGLFRDYELFEIFQSKWKSPRPLTATLVKITVETANYEPPQTIRIQQ